MSPLLRKEIKILLPAWLVTLAVGTAPLWLWLDFRGMLPLIFGAAILALSLAPFGHEMSYGTFGLLLVQPEDRRRFWRIKAGLLAAALASAWSLFTVCVSNSSSPMEDDWAMWLKISALMTFLAFSGGLWSTLLLRDTVSAFFCTLLVPGLICAATTSMNQWIKLDDTQFTTLLFCVLVAYGAAGFWWARRLFLRAEDTGWSGGQISMTSVRGVSLRWLAFKFTGRQNRWTASVKRELQSQEITMFLIPALTLLHLVVLILSHFAPQRIPQELIFTIPIIWLAAVPFVIGCVAVAEERRYNTLEGLLCLPMTKRGQFAVKLAVALVLGIVLGGILPWILLRLGGPRARELELQEAVEIAAAVTAIAFYASTMSRGLLQALPTTVCILALVGMIIAFVLSFTKHLGLRLTSDLAQSPLFPALAWPPAIITFLWLSFNNYKQLQIGWRLWLGNLIRVGVVTGCVTLTIIAIFFNLE